MILRIISAIKYLLRSLSDGVNAHIRDVQEAERMLEPLCPEKCECYLPNRDYCKAWGYPKGCCYGSRR